MIFNKKILKPLFVSCVRKGEAMKSKADVKNWAIDIRKLATDFFIDPDKANTIIANVVATKKSGETNKSMYQRAWIKLYRLM